MLETVRFDIMKEEDVPYIAQLESSIFSMPWREDDFREALCNIKKTFVVAKADEEIVGYCGVHQILDEGEITNVAVKDTHRRQGIAGRMLSYLLEVGSDMGITAFTLEVRASNQGAVKLYENAGFSVEGIRKDFYEKPKEDALIMWKR